MKRVALYMRVSTQEQAENGNSLEFQKEKLEAYCKIHEYKIVGEYVDAGISGAKFNRPALDRLKDDVDKIDVVLIYKLDRLSRSIKDTMLLIEDFFKPNKVDLISLSENFDTSQAIGMATVGMLSTFAQLERDTIKQRMMSGRVQAVKSGKYVCKVPYGYIKEGDKLIKDETTRDCVEFIFDKALEGQSLYEIIDSLEENGYGQYRKWSTSLIHKFIKRPVYRGHTTINDVLMENTHEPYITEKEFECINKLFTDRKCHSSKSGRNKLPAIFRGLINCPTCYRRVYPFTRTFKSGKCTTFYRCNFCGREKNIHFSFSEQKFEKKFLDYLKFDFKIDVEKPKVIKKDYSKKLSMLENKKNKLQRAWLNDLLTDNELKNLQEEIDNQIQLINLKQKEYHDSIISAKKQKNIAGLLVDFENIYSKLDTDKKIEFLNTIIQDIKTTISIEKRGKVHRTNISITNIIFK